MVSVLERIDCTTLFTLLTKRCKCKPAPLTYILITINKTAVGLKKRVIMLLNEI